MTPERWQKVEQLMSRRLGARGEPARSLSGASLSRGRRTAPRGRVAAGARKARGRISGITRLGSCGRSAGDDAGCRWRVVFGGSRDGLLPNSFVAGRGRVLDIARPRTGDDQPPHEVRPIQGQLLNNEASERKAQGIDMFEAKRFNKGGSTLGETNQGLRGLAGRAGEADVS